MSLTRRDPLAPATSRPTGSQDPVLEQCREHALATREPYGTWGGLSEVERRSLLAVTPRPVLLSAGAEPRGR